VAKKGHELGNHTLFHPCAGNTPGRGWVKPDYALEKYTPQRLTDELRMTNIFLEAIDNNKKRTFAYPCGDMRIGDSSYVEAIKNDFVAARGVTGRLDKINEVDLYNVSCFMINGESGDELIALVKKAMETNTLLVFLFHGVGGEHGLNVSLQAHNALLKYLKQQEKEIWIAPFIDITTHVAQYQSINK
jgi:sialate O-acetylesterase